MMRRAFFLTFCLLAACGASHGQCTLGDGSPCTGNIATGQIATSTPMYLQFSDPNQNLLVAETSAQQNFGHAAGFMTIQFSDSNLLTDTTIQVQYKLTNAGAPWTTTLSCALTVNNGLQLGTFCAGSSPPSNSDAALVITSPTNDTVGGLSWTITFYNSGGQDFWTLEDADPFMENNYVVPITTPSYGADANCSDASPCPQPLWLEFNSQGTTTDGSGETFPAIAVLGSPNLLTASDMLDSPDGSIPGNPSFAGPLQNAGFYGFGFSPAPDGFGFNWSSPNPLSMSPPAQISSTQVYVDGNITSPFTLYLNNSVTGVWSGSFDQGGTQSTAPSTINIQVLPNSSVIGQVILTPNSLCPGSPALVLDLSNPQAVANGVDPNDGISSLQVGDIGEISASDGTNTIWFVMSSVDNNSNFLGVGQKFITGFSLPTNIVCPGAYFYDRPFQVETKSNVRAVGPRRVTLYPHQEPQAGRHHHVTPWEKRIRAAIAESKHGQPKRFRNRGRN